MGFHACGHIFLFEIRRGIFSPQKGEILVSLKDHRRFSPVRHGHLYRGSRQFHPYPAHFFRYDRFSYENSLWQKLTVAFITASLGLSVSALLSELFPIELWSPMRGFIWLLLFLSIRRYHLQDDYQLSDSLWKLLFFLNLTPLGIVIAVCLGFPLSVAGENNPALSLFYLKTVEPVLYILLLLAILSFYGLLGAIKTLARQYRMERDQVLYETNRQYYLAVGADSV